MQLTRINKPKIVRLVRTPPGGSGYFLFSSPNCCKNSAACFGLASATTAVVCVLAPVLGEVVALGFGEAVGVADGSGLERSTGSGSTQVCSSPSSSTVPSFL